MTNMILASEANSALSELLAPQSIGEKSSASSARTSRTLQRSKAAGRHGRTGDQSLLRGLLDPKSSSLSLTALARAAAFSGKRLVLEIRDENPVRIVRTSIKGM